MKDRLWLPRQLTIMYSSISHVKLKKILGSDLLFSQKIRSYEFNYRNPTRLQKKHDRQKASYRKLSFIVVTLEGFSTWLVTDQMYLLRGRIGIRNRSGTIVALISVSSTYSHHMERVGLVSPLSFTEVFPLHYS